MNFTSSSVNLLFRNNELERVCKFIIYKIMNFPSPSVNLMFTECVNSLFTNNEGRGGWRWRGWILSFLLGFFLPEIRGEGLSPRAPSLDPPLLN